MLEWVKLRPQYLAPFSIATATILFTPSEFIKRLGLERLQTDFKLWVGVIFLASSTLLLSHALSSIWSYCASKVRQRSNLADLQKRLHTLSLDEKKVLMYYIVNNTKSQNLDYMDGIANGLEAAKILFRASTLGSAWGGFAYNIQPWAWEYLRQNPGLLE